MFHGPMDARSSKHLGKRVRSIRRQRGETLDQLAQATGLNKGYLSRIESGEKSPSIATLLKLTDALDVPTSQLFGEEVAEGDIQLVRGQGPSGSTDGYDVTLLSRGAPSPMLRTFLLRPTGAFAEDRRAEHSGVEGAYVIEGAIEIQFTDRTVGLAAGDYVQFPGHLTHQIRKTAETATVLIVIAET